MLTDKQQGIVTPPGSVEALREGLHQLLRDANLAAMGAKGREWAKSFYWPEIARQYLHVFEQAREKYGEQIPNH